MIMEVFSPEDARKYAEYMYDPAFRPEPHQAEWVHTALAAAAGYTAHRSYNDYLAKQGRSNLEQPDPSTMKDTLASCAYSEVDKVVSMKGLNFIDIQRVKTHATEEALYLANQQYGPSNSGIQPGPTPMGGEAASYYNAGPSSHQGQAPAYAPPSGPPPGYQPHASSLSTEYAHTPQVGYAMQPQPPHHSEPAYGDHKVPSAPHIPTHATPGPTTFQPPNIPNLSDRDRRKLEKQQRKAQRKAEKEQTKGMSKEAKRALKEQRRAAKRAGREERRARRRGGRRGSRSSDSSSSSSDLD